jgi:hypothetical protein
MAVDDYRQPIPPLFLCRCLRLIVLSLMDEKCRESCLRRNAYFLYEIDACQYCMLVKLAINVNFYLSVMLFRNGFFTHYSLPSSYHIKIGSGFPMELVGLAPYFNGARFSCYSLLEFLSVSSALCIRHQPSFGGLNVCSFCISMYSCNSKTTFDAFCTRVNRAWIHTKLSW